MSQKVESDQSLHYLPLIQEFVGTQRDSKK